LIKPDLVAPGNRVRGLLAPGATLAREHPELVIGTGRDAQLQLSGTSMAAGVVSGAVSLLLETFPRLTPVRTRVSLQYSSERSTDEPLLVGGAGRLHILSAFGSLRQVVIPPIAGEQQFAGMVAFSGVSVDAVILKRFTTPPRSDLVDAIIWGSLADAIVWGSSADAIIWGSSADAIIWGSSNDAIIWGSYADAIVWGSSTDAIRGEWSQGRQ
jgi:subtilisin family serine protease